jgi:hypothetical protein
MAKVPTLNQLMKLYEMKYDRKELQDVFLRQTVGDVES